MTAAARRSAHKVCRYLAETYPTTRLQNPRQPLDDLVFIILSNRTTPTLSQTAFARLKSAGPWTRIREMSPAQIARLIKRAGLSTKKAKWIHAILGQLAAAFGRPTLHPLRSMKPAAQLTFLCRLPGVSVKVAKCVMMYTLDAKVLPVDVHVHRLATRLGWVTVRRADARAATLEPLIAPAARFRFHVNAIQHGRSVCTSSNPRCTECCLASICPRVGVTDAAIEK